MDFDYYIDDSFQEDKDDTVDDVESSEDVSANDNDAAALDDKVESSDVGTEKPVSSDSNSEESISSDEEVVFPHLIGKKIGMTQLFLGQGNAVTATVLEMGPCFVTQIKKESREGYNSIQLSYGDISKSNKALTGHFSKFDQSPKKHLKEFRCSDKQLDFNLGEVLTIKQFELGDFVKVTGTSKGKGFTGHMKRHGFGGGRRSHGKNSVMRKAGSVGAGSDPSRVFPGMKMAGRKGNYKKTIKNLSVIKLDYENNLIFVTGSVPGANNGLVYLSKI
ncbi:MAG: 50S ribosomal protein L3 [Candidatus Marinimicrobia bacterium]|nr:50S ribosomal protein L3 [Candidatus Neomarinimicrobiota bacterium]